MATEALRPRGRPAHTPGTTVLTYTPNGRRIVTGGSNSAIRVYTVGEDGEPKTIDEGVDGNLGIGATNDSFIMGAEDGTVWKYGIESGKMEQLLVRCALPVRDLAVTKDGEWVAVASDELTVKLVNIENMTIVKYLRDQAKGTKHVSFDPNGRYIAVSCTDGLVYIYSSFSDEPELVRKLDGVIRRLEPEDEATSRIVWHPDGTAFASAEATRDVAIYSVSEWKKEKVFSGGHNGDITSVSWSPNGALLATAGADGQILIWETKTQKVLHRYDFGNVINLAWHPSKNSLSFTTSDGELFIYDGFLPEEHQHHLQKPLQAAPIFPGVLAEVSGNAARSLTNRPKESIERPRRAGTPDSLDDLLGSDQGMEDFVEDDDGAGYAEGVNPYGKRTNEHLEDIDGHLDKRLLTSYSKPKTHQPLQSGSTPWRGNRRYLCLNLTGCVWTVDQETHNTVTVEFYDRELHRDFHFTDPYLYDRACLNENGTLFSNNPTDGSPATIFYRPHETWTTRADWRTQLPQGELIRALALSESYIVAVTTKDYVRVYTLFGTPFKVFRQKSPAVTCAAWRDYVMTIGNGPLGSDGLTATLKYSIENVKRDEVCQNEDVVALPEGSELRSVFFSDSGVSDLLRKQTLCVQHTDIKQDPCIYDSEGVLLILQHWRINGQARWVPLLDTKQLERLAGGRKEETYWPVAVAQEKFHCIILKGGDKYPYFPRPLLSEFDFRVPISDAPHKDSSEEEEDGASRDDAAARFEESFVRGNVLLSLFQDLLSSTNATPSQRAELARKEIELDKILLQMLAVECREGEERGMKALELVGMMKDRSGKMIEAAAKVAERYGRGVLEDKIRDLAEKRFMGTDDDDELA
ncbi:WD40 repeat domain-containing protein [Aspergillus clavatus NRRL 1]|uniref:Chromosome segregation protein (SepB), putative n=1 Tax=Aspergillus clavatus (strain ATCC 1007 / CBS 513.65 / DSM 816 / NCTC 3887 / NRRL 1 / QM 1276 / 107) TaxID=344612 RepID=A1CQT4_ASPCL|nr:chromosome segregation protein (SepB), putative [Aspergillus clavatus NRRL 1]EAW08005.1 chromosome segregation protein (SepB), putative [Aspergillus clavatus NRRL 1]